MKNKIAIGLFGVLSLVGCSTDDSKTNSDSSNGFVLSNEEMTLTYRTNALKSNLTIKNKPIDFIKLSESTTNHRSASYTIPDLTNAIPVTGNNWVNFINGNTYYIPEGETFTGGINFNSGATLVILGTLGGSNWINVQNGGVVEVAPSGEILSTCNFHLNANSTLNNYGKVTYITGSVDGQIYNYNEMIFTQSSRGNTFSINGSSTVENHCKMTFNNKVHINGTLDNNSYLKFKNAFHINGNGKLNLSDSSLTDVLGGTITIDGKVKNSNNAFARLDIDGATIGTLNANPAFEGKIDINIISLGSSSTIPSNKVDANVVFNADTYIAADGCIEASRGTAACDENALTLTLIATVDSPETEDGHILSATGVQIYNNRAFVSYHTNDEFYGDAPEGALRIIDVQNPYSPDLFAEAFFNNAEFNGVEIQDNTVYAVGGNKAGAHLVTVDLINNEFPVEDLDLFKTYKLPSTSGKNAFVNGDNLWLVTGAQEGGFFKLDINNNFDVIDQIYGNGSRSKYVAQNGVYQAFFAVEDTGARLHIANIDGSNSHVYTYPNLKQDIVTGKNVIAMDDQYVYVALSDKGVAKINLANGEVVNHFEPNTYRVNGTGPKVFRENGYTNGVAVNGCFLYLANGADGVIVLNKESFNVVGYFKLDNSSNYVYAKDDLLFVATGRSGLNIIKVN